VSSSLHGIIAADAYSIPSLWVEFSNKVLGNGFKFVDYFKSVGRDVEDSVVISSAMSLSYILNAFDEYKIEIDLDALIKSAPFEINEKYES